MNKKPIIALAAAAGFALPAGAFVAADATAQSGKPRVSDLDVDQKRGNALRIKVDATGAQTVKLTYAGTTKTARLKDSDADDDDQEFVARFAAKPGDGAGDRVRVRVVAEGAGGTTTRTLSDRVDADDDDRRGDDREDRDDDKGGDRDRDDRDDDSDDRDDDSDDRDDDSDDRDDD